MDRRQFVLQAAVATLAGANGESELLELDATDAVERIRRGELSAEKYVARLIERCRATKSLNVFTWMDEARTLEQARSVDQQRARGKKLGVLSGCPVAIKDNIDVAGTPTAAGTAGLRQNMRSATAPVAAKLFEQGAVFFGRANMHELAAGATSRNPRFGFVGNPYDALRVAGGSSGGTAAAIGARVVPAGLGTDTAGSVRIPAALSGVVGLRPTKYPNEGVVPLARELDTAGPMGRSVRDVALLHSVIAGTRLASPDRPRGIRLGVPRRVFWDDVDPGVARLAEDAVARLRDAGAVLVDVDAREYYLPASEAYGTFVMAGIKEDLSAYLQTIDSADVMLRIASGDTRELFERARGMHISAEQRQAARTMLRERAIPAYRALFERYGIAGLVFPTVPIVAPLIDGSSALEELALIRNTHVTGALGVPGLSIPAGLTAEGLPVGLEVDGLAGRDVELLALGLTIERVLGRLPAPGLR